MPIDLFRGVGAFFPRRVTVKDRLAMLPRDAWPLEAAVSVRWNHLAVPYIRASSDRDAAVALGIVHAHLRGSQVELLKRLARGRLSEVAGPPAIVIDHALRLIDYGRAAEASLDAMPETSRQWLDAFTAGYNAAARRLPAPPEARLFGIRPEDLTPADVVAIGRLAGSDINWFTYITLLRARARPGWHELFRRLLVAGAGQTPSFRQGPGAALEGIVAANSRSGSNCVVVAAARSASGGAMIASDPHLGLSLPNFWLLVGIISPSYRVVGMMPPGLPVIGLGRNPGLAWGGTNMRAANSDLFDVSKLPRTTITTREVPLRPRFWRSRSLRLRDSSFGPIVSDHALFKGAPDETLALSWTGHLPSDDVGAFLGAMRARDGAQFRQAFASFAVAGQNMLYATAKGEIGQIMAVFLPDRPRSLPSDIVLDPRDPEVCWRGVLTACDLPHVENPREGVLASANNVPTRARVPVGYFFVPDERVERLQALLAGPRKVTHADLMALQRDVFSSASLALKETLVAAIETAGLETRQSGFFDALKAWDGHYHIEARGPVCFETLLAAVTERLHAEPDRRGRRRVPAERSQWNMLVRYFASDLEARSPEVRRDLLAASLDQAAKDARSFAQWGEMHRLRLGHVLARLPGIGRRLLFADVPVSGSRETAMKAAHGLVRGRHGATYGQQARHISDLADIDANWFCLLGGQDGWLGSDAFADQLTLWREGKYVRMPLSDAAIEAEYPTETVLTPAVRDESRG